MAISAVSSQDVLSSRLNVLVRRARTVKKETSIDPPLQISALLEDNEPLVERIEPRDLRDLTAESAAKSILYPILSSARISDPSFVDVWNLLDVVQGCADRDLCSNQLVLLLAEEVLDSLSIADCHVAFNYLESRREAILSVSEISNHAPVTWLFGDGIEPITAHPSTMWKKPLTIVREALGQPEAKRWSYCAHAMSYCVVCPAQRTPCSVDVYMCFYSRASHWATRAPSICEASSILEI
jgi:hypothetical protein